MLSSKVVHNKLYLQRGSQTLPPEEVPDSWFYDYHDFAAAICDASSIMPNRPCPGAVCLFGSLRHKNQSQVFTLSQGLTGLVFCRATVPVEKWEDYYLKHIDCSYFPLFYSSGTVPKNGQKTLFWVTEFSSLFCDRSFLSAPAVFQRYQARHSPAA